LFQYLNAYLQTLCCYPFFTQQKNQDKKENPKIQEDTHEESLKIAQVCGEGPK
jgi:hypothetical protein